MNTFAYTAFASVIALVPILYVLRRNRSTARAPPVKLEFFPATHAPTGPVVVVTGGSGFVGRRIIELLLQEPQQYRIVVLDVLLPVVKHASVTYVRGDICDPKHVEAAFKDATAVLHVASIIPSLRTQASPIIERVNVGGTRVVIDACKSCRVPRLIYTSSATIVISPQDFDLRGIDETFPHLDSYTVTKAAADALVLQANAPSSGLVTCVIRPAAVFGPGDKLVSDSHVINKGHVVIGTGTALIDWVYVDNVAAAHVQALAALIKGGAASPLAGQAYFIGSSFSSTDVPRLSYGQFNGLPQSEGESSQLDHWGHPPPRLLPLPLVNALARFNEALFALTGCTFDDMLSRTSVLYTQRTYFFNSSKAKRDFGYAAAVSVKQGIDLVVKAVKEGRHPVHSPQAAVRLH